MAQSQAPEATTCDDLRSDYFECLHHKKELVEVKRLKDEARVAHQKKLAEVAVIRWARQAVACSACVWVKGWLPVR